MFTAWTDKAQVAQWWGPEGLLATHDKWDASAGGEYRTSMAAPDGSEHVVSGTFKEVTPHSRVVFTWAWDNDGERGHETEVIVEFEARGDQCLVRLEQRVFTSEEFRDQHNDGWSSSFNKLDGLLA